MSKGIIKIILFIVFLFFLPAILSSVCCCCCCGSGYSGIGCSGSRKTGGCSAMNSSKK